MTSLARRLAAHGRPFYLPITFALSLRMEQVSWSEACADCGLAAYALRNGMSVFSADGLVNWFDPWLEAEAFGVRLDRNDRGQVAAVEKRVSNVPTAEIFAAAGAVPAAIDLARRLCSETGDRHAVLGYLTGGATIVRHALDVAARGELETGDDISQLPAADQTRLDAIAQCSVYLARQYCEAGVAALLVAEEVMPSGAIQSACEPLFNLADYYATPIVILHRDKPTAAVIDRYRAAGAYSVLYAAEDQGRDGVVVPLSASAEDAGNGSGGAAIAAPHDGHSQLITTAWDLPADCAADRVIAVGRNLLQ